MRIIPEFLLVLLASAAITAERIDTLPEVLNVHRQAMGDPPQSLQLDLAIEESGFKLTARYLASRQPAMRVDVYADGERVFSEGLVRDAAWQWPAADAQPTPASEAGAGALLRGITNNLYGLHERPRLGYRLSYDGLESHDNKDYWKVTSHAPDDFREVYFINVETGLIERKEEWSALHPDMDATELHSITHYLDYRWHDGHRVNFASEKRDAASDTVLQRVTVTEARVNPRLPEQIFEAISDQVISK